MSENEFNTQESLSPLSYYSAIQSVRFIYSAQCMTCKTVPPLIERCARDADRARERLPRPTRRAQHVEQTPCYLGPSLGLARAGKRATLRTSETRGEVRQRRRLLSVSSQNSSLPKPHSGSNHYCMY